MNYQTILCSLEKSILLITINRAQKHNALSTATLKEISAALEDAEKNTEVLGIIITGAGEKSFISGADISEFVGLSETQAQDLARFGQNALKKIEASSKPILAAINGYAFGGGCELAMACHLRIASDNAKFSQPEVNLGIMAGYGGTQRLIQYIGKTKAMEMHLTGKVIDANEALKLGLLNDVVPQKLLLEKSKDLLNLIISKSPLTTSRIIKSVNSFFENEEVGYETEIEEFGKCFTTNDFKEGVAAFFEKRKPNFKGN